MPHCLKRGQPNKPCQGLLHCPCVVAMNVGDEYLPEYGGVGLRTKVCIEDRMAVVRRITSRQSALGIKFVKSKVRNEKKVVGDKYMFVCLFK